MWRRRTKFRWLPKRPKCVNCQGNHFAISIDCPKWKLEKDIVKYTEKISFADARKRLQPSFDPSKDSYATVTQTPPQSSRPLPPWARKTRLPTDFKTEVEYFKLLPDTIGYIRWNYFRKSSSTTPEQNTESTLQFITSAASNDDEMELNTASIKRPIHEDSSEEESTNPLPSKRTAPGSPTIGKNGTVVPKGTGRGDLSKISTFCPNTPKLGGRGSGREDKSPIRAPHFSTNTGEGSVCSAQGGRNRGAINRHPPLKPPATTKTATKNQIKSKEKNTHS